MSALCLFQCGFRFLLRLQSLGVSGFLYLFQDHFLVLLYGSRPELKSFQYRLIQHVIADIVHRTVAFAKLPVKTASEIAVRRFVGGIRSKPHKPATVSAFDKSGEYLCFLVLSLSASGLDKLLHTEKHVLVNDRFVGILHSEPFTFRLADFLLVLERNSRLLIMHAVSYVDFVFQYRLDLCYCPCVTLALRRICKDMCECSVSLVVYPRGCGYFFFNQRLCDFCPAVALIGK